MIATAAVEQSGGVFAAPVIAWQDLALVVLGLLLLGLARVVVHRRRRAEDHAGEVPLIEVPMPAPPGQPPRPTWPTPVRQRRADARVSQESAAAQNASTEVQAGLVRFHRPPEGTLQLLPGRLEIISGKEGVDEIRFVKVPGKEPVITFGRSPGEPHTHIELQ